MRELVISKAELFALGESMLKTRKTKTARRRIAQFLGLGREIFDEQAKRIHDPAGSAQHLEIEVDDDEDDREEEGREPRWPAAPEPEAQDTRRQPDAGSSSEPSVAEHGHVEAGSTEEEATADQGQKTGQPRRRTNRVTWDD